MQQPPPGRVSAAALLDTLGIPAAAAAPAASSASNASAAAAAAAAAGADVDEEPRPNETPVERDLRALFEARRPLRPVMQGSSAPVLQRSLNAELTCPVCLGIIRDCTAVMECLHRFCAVCIEKSLRFGKKECPSCRVTVASRRNLRRDEAFSAVIAAIYPDLAQAEQAHDSYIQDVIRNMNVRKFGNIASKGSRQQKDHARKSVKRPASPPPVSGMDGGMGVGAGGSGTIMPLAKRPRNPNKPEAISFSLLQHPELAASTLADAYRMRNKFVRTSRYITTLLLKKWLQLKLLTPKPAPTPAAAVGIAAIEAPKTEAKAEGETGGAATEAAAAQQPPQDEQKSGAAADASNTKMEDTPAAAAASSSGPSSAAASPTPSAAAAAAPSVPANVRFVLYVRAFDTTLLEPQQLPIGPGVPAGKEVFVPLASDLTLDFIEEHMWHSDARHTDAEAAAINAEIAAASTAAGDATGVTSALQRAFRQSFASCSTHKKLKAPCNEDCTERMGAWHLFFTKEKEKIDKWKAEQDDKKKAAEAATTPTASSADTGAAAGAGGAAPSAASPVAAATATATPLPSLISLPHKKRRLVLYYSVVGADGQLLLNAPVLAPEVVQKYVIRTAEDDEDDEEEATGEQEGAATNATEGGNQQQPQQSSEQQPPLPPSTDNNAADRPSPMQMDEEPIAQAS